MRASKQHGLTLVELLLAVAISIMIGGILVAAFRGSLQLWKKFSLRSDLNTGLMQLTSALEKDIRESLQVYSLSDSTLVLKQSARYVKWAVYPQASEIVVHRFVSSSPTTWQIKPGDREITLPNQGGEAAVKFLTLEDRLVSYSFSNGHYTVTGRMLLRKQTP